KAQPYIQYEEREAADSIRHSRSEANPPRRESNHPPRESSQKEGGKKKQPATRTTQSVLELHSPHRFARAHPIRVLLLGIQTSWD
ncbi:hypothetical protein A2U01_0057594, partial [Trifolium medium]|nr:hypothetical protein [Trifolium medium]